MGHYGDRSSTREQLRRAEAIGLIRGVSGEFTIRSIAARAARVGISTMELLEAAREMLKKYFLVSMSIDVSYVNLDEDDLVRAAKMASAKDQIRHMDPAQSPRPQIVSTCSRCQMRIVGKGRHGKTKRGHTKEECDVRMFENIHKA